MFVLTFEEYDQFIELIDSMDYKAGSYAPTVAELYEIVASHLSYFMKGLIWIDETGYETDDNRKSRRIIRKILNENLILVETEEEAEELAKSSGEEIEFL